mgnify:CR=1 FL=1
MNYYPEHVVSHADSVETVVTRFPPEPNGYLHIGHVKAMNVDFGLAKDAKEYMNKDSACIMRFDDTNPLSEKEEYTNSILQNLEWLGNVPSKVTYTSDYFHTLYDLAVTLITSGNAYVCELSGDDISKYRKDKIESPYKNRPVEESLKLFEGMKNGQFENNKMTLRMKGDLSNPNSCMWDLIFYRIIHSPHHRTRDEWCIYPSYDFAHCIVDSLEGITHSLCTIEFEMRRESYYWLLDKLNLHKPLVYEFGRLNITNNVLSKRVLKSLVESKLVRGWDDPRLLTINGLKRRGYEPSVLVNFCKQTGLTKINATVEMEKLEFFMREYLDPIVPRRFVIKNPVKVTFVEDIEEDMNCTLYDFPMYMKKIMEGDESVPSFAKSTREMKVTQSIFIDRSDFKTVDENKYFGLAPGKYVRLKYSGFIKCIGYSEKDNDVSEIMVKFEAPPNPKKVKGVLSWVNSDAVQVELRLYGRLFNKEYDGDIPLNELVNENSLQIVNALGEPSLSPSVLTCGDRFQFERVGYFCVDPDSTKEKTVFNSIVDQKSSYVPK